MKNLIIGAILGAIVTAGVFVYINRLRALNAASEIATINKSIEELHSQIDSIDTRLVISYDLIKKLDTSNHKLRYDLKNERQKNADRIKFVTDATIEQHLEYFTARTD
jgi:hypothetical protein